LVPSLLIPAGTQATTTPSERAAPVVFETDEDLDALPTDLVAAWFKPASAAAAADQTGPLALAEQPVPAPDGLTVTIATASLKAELYLGFTVKPAVGVPLSLRFGVRDNPSRAKFTLVWAASVAAPGVWSDDFVGTGDGTNGLTRSGLLTVKVPTDPHAAWAARSAVEVMGAPAAQAAQRKLFWLRATLSGVGSVVLRHVLLNSVPASTALSAVPAGTRERLGTTDERPGVPFQALTLRYTPVYRVPGVPDPFGHVKVSVVAAADPPGAPGTRWPAGDDWPPGNVTAVRLSAPTGTVQFGSFDPATARRPREAQRPRPHPAGPRHRVRRRLPVRGDGGRRQPASREGHRASDAEQGRC